MRSKFYLALAAMGASVLLPASGAFADHHEGEKKDTVKESSTKESSTREASMSTTAGSMAAGATDVTVFRGDLRRVKDRFLEMRENSRLALASPDPVLQSQHLEDNRRLLTRTLSLMGRISKNWRSVSAPAGSMDRLGSSDMRRYAAESEDTAFVRSTVWELKNRLQSEQLNGRGPVITEEMMSMLDAAISRAENPTFRVATREVNRERLSRRIELSRTEGVTTPARPAEETAREEEVARTEERVEETRPAPEAAAEERTVERTEETTTVETTPTEEPTPAAAEETVVEEQVESAPLPRTGGNPGLFLLLGSSLIGLGAFLRRR